jgi:hypothetical protein
MLIRHRRINIGYVLGIVWSANRAGVAQSFPRCRINANRFEQLVGVLAELWRA